MRPDDRVGALRRDYLVHFVPARYCSAAQYFIAVVALSIVLALPAGAADGLRIYVSNEDSGEISVLDPSGAGQVLQRLSVGKRPRGIKLAPDGRLLYVALSGSPNAGPEWMSPSSRPRTARRME